jgi:hypothetical protein
VQVVDLLTSEERLDGDDSEDEIQQGGGLICRADSWAFALGDQDLLDSPSLCSSEATFFDWDLSDRGADEDQNNLFSEPFVQQHFAQGQAAVERFPELTDVEEDLTQYLRCVPPSPAVGDPGLALALPMLCA